MRALSILALLSPLAVPPQALAQPEIALYTFGPGDSVAERFGHSAIRVTDGDDDVLYNLGHPAGSAEGVGFFVALVQGDTEFVGTVGEAEAAIARYRAVDRSIRLQQLSLNPARALWLAEKLRVEVGGGRFSYRYDYLRDNCTTEIRDLLDAATDGALRRAADEHERGPTYRALTLDGFRGHFPTLLGADLLSGPEQDRPITRWEELFLPDALHDAVADVAGLAPRSRTTYERRGPPVQRGSPHLGRFAVFSLSLVVFGLLVASRRFPRLTPVAGAGLAMTAPMIAFTGLGAWFLMATSSLPDLTWNEHVIVMWPTDLLLVVPGLSWMRGRPLRHASRLRGYVAFRLVTIALLLGAKLAGLAVQDNASYVAGTVLVFVGALVRANATTQKRIAT